MATGGLSLLPHSLKPKSPIEQQGSSHPVGRQVILKGPAAVTDTVIVAPADSVSSRADSLEVGLVDPKTFTTDEFIQQYERAIDLWYQRHEFLKQVNGLADDHYDWT